MTMQRANHKPQPTNEQIEEAIAAIWAVLNVDGIAGWNDWNRYAATGEWQ